MGLGVTDLAYDQKTMVVEKYLATLHPELQGFLEIREVEPDFDNIAQIATKIELARNIPRIRPAAVNNFQATRVSHDDKMIQNAGKKPILMCDFCKGKGHTTDWCYGNPTSKKYNSDCFKAVQATRALIKSQNEQTNNFSKN